MSRIKKVDLVIPVTTKRSIYRDYLTGSARILLPFPVPGG